MPEVRVAVFATVRECDRVMRLARVERMLPLQTWQFITIGEADHPQCLGSIQGDIVLGLDDIDIMLDHGIPRLRWPVRFITITGELV
jgi:hypothetical protein